LAESEAKQSDPRKEAVGARARNAVEDFKWRAPTRSVGRRPFKPSMLARAYHIATLLNPVESPLIKDSQTIKEVVNRIV
jgi:hypothetical protein